MDWVYFILYMKLNEKKKKLASCERMNKQMDSKNFILYMKLNEKKKSK